jgi:hypothetical protein
MNTKKAIVSGFLCFFLISPVFSQRGEYEGGASFTKRIEYNLIMLYEVYNLRSKEEVEKLFFGDFNAPVEFFYNPSFRGASGFRIVKDSLAKSCTLEIKYVVNYEEAFKEAAENIRQIDIPQEMWDSLPKDLLQLMWDYNSNGAKGKRLYEELTKHLKVETRSFTVSDRFSELFYSKMVSFIDKFKGRGVPPTVLDGYSVVFRTVVEDEVWSLAIHMPNGEALKMADLCRQITTDAEKNEWDESKYIVLLDKFGEE